MRKPAIPLFALLASLLLGGCGVERAEGSTRTSHLVVTEVPSGSASEALSAVAPVPDGARLLVVDVAGESPPVPISAGMAAAGHPVVSWDGRSVIFVGREHATDPNSVWKCGAGGERRQRIVGGDQDCSSAALLADGRICYAARLADAPEVSELFLARGDGAPGERITFTGAMAVEPVALRDGRIAFRRETGLFTVHPDGTGVAPLHLDLPGDARILRPRQLMDGTLVCATEAIDTTAPSGIVRIDWGAPMSAGRLLDFERGGVLAAESMADGSLLVTCAPAGSAPGGVFRVDPAEPAISLALALPVTGLLVEAVELSLRRPPQGHMSMVSPGTPFGDLMCVDARTPGCEEALRVRVLTGGEVLGDVELETDGSFFIRVPPDRPLTLELVDASGAIVSAQHTPMWVRPKETRGCIGCHEDPALAPPNRRPQAVLHPPVSLGAEVSAELGR